MDPRAVDELHVLADRDEELSAGMLVLEKQDAAVAHIRARCDGIGTFFDAYPDRVSQLRTDVAKAERELAARQVELAEAERLADAQSSGEEGERAARAVARSRDRVALAVAQLTRTRSDQTELDGDAAELRAELKRLEVDARELSGGLPHLPVPGPGPGEIAAWASHAHAALFVAITQVTTERDMITREANELASMLLGEGTYGSTAAQALRQVEARAGSTARQGS
jgi:hypothetical protein